MQMYTTFDRQTLKAKILVAKVFLVIHNFLKVLPFGEKYFSSRSPKGEASSSSRSLSGDILTSEKVLSEGKVIP